MKRPRILSVACGLVASTVLLSASPAAFAGNGDFVPSTEASRNAHVVTTGVHWYTTLEDAQTAAKKQGKLVLWIHMLGTMEGAT
jgi:hypothetical protein